MAVSHRESVQKLTLVDDKGKGTIHYQALLILLKTLSLICPLIYSIYCDSMPFTFCIGK